MVVFDEVLVFGAFEVLPTPAVFPDRSDRVDHAVVVASCPVRTIEILVDPNVLLSAIKDLHDFLVERTHLRSRLSLAHIFFRCSTVDGFCFHHRPQFEQILERCIKRRLLGVSIEISSFLIEFRG